jgi:hypothetical protein
VLRLEQTGDYRFRQFGISTDLCSYSVGQAFHLVGVGISPKQVIAMDSKFLRHFTEWHSRHLLNHIKGLYDQAVADKFEVWE